MKKQSALRPIDLARAVDLSVQMVRNYEAWGFLPPAERSTKGYRLYRPHHLQAMQVARALIAGYGWQTALHIMQHVHADGLSVALAIVDAYHASHHQQRQQIEATLQALRTLSATSIDRKATSEADEYDEPLSIGAAARLVGVRVSALRFWEAQGLLQPQRDPISKYRRYDGEQLRRLQVVALLRAGGYGFDVIRAVLEQLAASKPERAISAAEQRLEELTETSKRCVEALASFWTYVQETTVVDGGIDHGIQT